MIDKPTTTFVSSPLKPILGDADSTTMATGAPCLPGAFTWKRETLSIARVMRSWKEAGPCRNGRSESYIRKHWFEVETADRRIATIYFERQPRGRKSARWWLYSIEEPA